MDKQQKLYVNKLKESIASNCVTMKKRLAVFPNKMLAKCKKLTYSDERTITVGDKTYQIKEAIDETSKLYKELLKEAKPTFYADVLKSFIRESRRLENKNLEALYDKYDEELSDQFKKSKEKLYFCMEVLKDLPKIIKEEKKEKDVKESMEYDELRLDLYRKCSEGLITVEERENSLMELDDQCYVQELGEEAPARGELSYEDASEIVDEAIVTEGVSDILFDAGYGLLTVGVEIAALSPGGKVALAIGSLATGAVLNKTTRTLLQARISRYAMIKDNKLIPITDFTPKKYSIQEAKKYLGGTTDFSDRLWAKSKCYIYEYKGRKMCGVIKIAGNAFSTHFSLGSGIVLSAQHSKKQTILFMIDPVCKSNEDYYTASMCVKYSIFHPSVKRVCAEMLKKWKAIAKVNSSIKSVKGSINDKLSGRSSLKKESYDFGNMSPAEYFVEAKAEIYGRYASGEIDLDGRELLLERVRDTIFGTEE